MIPSQRSKILPFRAMDVVAKANQAIGDGRDVIMMCIGQPSSPAPSTALMAARRALEHGKIGYTDAAGISALRKRIAQYYLERYGTDIDPRRVFVTTGSSAGFTLSFLAAFDPGDRIVIPSPGYPAYRNILKSLSLEPVEIETLEQDRWTVSADQLDELHSKERVHGILIANPNNPNGTMMAPEAFRALVDRAANLSIKFISDEIYHGLTWGQAEVTALEVNDDSFIINSFSKYFCMTGWRIGWMIVPEDMIDTVDRLQQNIFICAPEVSQIAALAAFDGIDEMNVVKQGYEKNRDLVIKRLNQLGLTRIHPIDGAFYAYANTSGIAEDSLILSNRILQEADVAVTPGLDFDPVSGNKWMRFSFAGDNSRLSDGFDRLDEWMARQNA